MTIRRFSLIELLTVIALMTILLTVVTHVGRTVLLSQRQFSRAVAAHESMRRVDREWRTWVNGTDPQYWIVDEQGFLCERGRVYVKDGNLVIDDEKVPRIVGLPRASRCEFETHGDEGYVVMTVFWDQKMGTRTATSMMRLVASSKGGRQ